VPSVPAARHGFAGFGSQICGVVGYGFWMPKLRVVESRICGAGIGFCLVNRGFLGVGGGRFLIGGWTRFWWFGWTWFWASEVGGFVRLVRVRLESTIVIEEV